MRILSLFSALMVAVWVSGSALAAELVMLVQPGCVWCERWDAEVGVAYANTPEGKRAPLRKVDITHAWPDDLVAVRKERLTPTFILVRNGVEIDRLRGYPGEHFFWPLFAGMLEKLPEEIN
ncbi:hypothetical protein GCM10011316_31140 [Roseibium aquae]|uniref:Transcriptional regulator n=1 Tax=Roseibium aquae TaxID=1323746 RepID=A0A916TP83_9HYPH|nr:transcriptional regulator [Roseibium aquae]GGB56801.1 hypothetical protein GCM10011316_31140 [Roseibium aquae]